MRNESLHTINNRSGFTLLELMIVSTIIALMAMMVTPVFSGSFRSIRAENAARNFFTMMNYGHNAAISNAIEYRLYLDDESSEYWLEHAGIDEEGASVFIRLEDHHVGIMTLPDTLTFGRPKARHDSEDNSYYVSFFPSGVCDTTTIEIVVEDREREVYTYWTEGTQVRWERPSK